MLQMLLDLLKEIYPFLLAGGTAVAALYAINWLNKDPDSSYAKYIGLVVQAVKVAEKAIPDNVENKSLAKANLALQEFIELYESHTGKAPNEALIAWFKRTKEIVLLHLESKKNVQG